MQISVPLMPGRRRSTSTRSGLMVTAFSKPARPSPDQHGAEALLLQHHADGVAQAFVVVDHENGLHFAVVLIVPDLTGTPLLVIRVNFKLCA